MMKRLSRCYKIKEFILQLWFGPCIDMPRKSTSYLIRFLWGEALLPSSKHTWRQGEVKNAISFRCIACVKHICHVLRVCVCVCLCDPCHHHFSWVSLTFMICFLMLFTSPLPVIGRCCLVSRWGIDWGRKSGSTRRVDETVSIAEPCRKSKIFTWKLVLSFPLCQFQFSRFSDHCGARHDLSLCIGIYTTYETQLFVKFSS